MGVSRAKCQLALPGQCLQNKPCFLVTQMKSILLAKCCSNRITQTFYHQSWSLMVDIWQRCQLSALLKPSPDSWHHSLSAGATCLLGKERGWRGIDPVPGCNPQLRRSSGEGSPWPQRSSFIQGKQCSPHTLVDGFWRDQSRRCLQIIITTEA